MRECEVIHRFAVGGETEPKAAGLQELAVEPFGQDHPYRSRRAIAIAPGKTLGFECYSEDKWFAPWWRTRFAPEVKKDNVA